MARRRSTAALALLVTVATSSTVAAQETMPSVAVNDQLSLDGSVLIDQVTAADPGFIVIHADSGEGSPGPVVGFAPVAAGESADIVVPVDPAGVTTTLFAMLHVDTGEPMEFFFVD